MKRALITADLHFSDKEREGYRHKFMVTFREIAQQEQVDVILILGDLCQEKDYHSAWLVNAVVDHMQLLTKIAPVIIIRGNHDYLDITSPFFRFLNRVPGVTWIDKPTDRIISGTTVAFTPRWLFLPHTRDHARDWVKSGLSERFREYKWIFTHNTFAGARSESGKVMGGIPLDAFPPGPRVVSGDVHVPQKIGPVIYVGAPYHVRFGDDFPARVLLLEGDDLVSIPTDDLPQKQLVEITDVSQLKRVQVAPGDIVKVRVVLPAAETDRWNEVADAVHAWGEAAGVRLETAQPKIQEHAAIRPRRSLADDEMLMADYVRQKGHNDRMLNTGLRILDDLEQPNEQDCTGRV